MIQFANLLTITASGPYLLMGKENEKKNEISLLFAFFTLVCSMFSCSQGTDRRARTPHHDTNTELMKLESIANAAMLASAPAISGASV